MWLLSRDALPSVQTFMKVVRFIATAMLLESKTARWRELHQLHVDLGGAMLIHGIRKLYKPYNTKEWTNWIKDQTS